MTGSTSTTAMNVAVEVAAAVRHVTEYRSLEAKLRRQNQSAGPSLGSEFVVRFPLSRASP